VYPPVGKPITQLDIDADLAESSKPWRLPGADQSDYFNYGFDEFSWEMYRQKQTSMSAELTNQKQEMSQLQQMFGMGGAGPGPAMGGAPAPPSGPSGAPTGPSNGGGAMPGAMPVPPGGMDEAQMAMFFQQMAAQGGDMSQMANMDFGQFMQMAQGGQGGMGGGGGGFGGPQGGGNAYGQGNQGGGGGRGGGRRGRGNW
jgi:pre-mRNA 3'-end-processing factor FIP1